MRTMGVKTMQIYSALMFLCLMGLVGGNLQAAIQRNLQAMREAQGRIQGIVKKTFPSTMMVRRLLIVGLDVGIGRGFFDVRNLMSYTHQMYKGRDITFLVEQDGHGKLFAEFNGRTVSCSGLAQDRFKQCKVPVNYRPWTGRFTVQTFGQGGRQVSAGFTMAAKAFCPNAGFDGDMCTNDIDECQKFRGKPICGWILGCVNTHGSYRCRCPVGYKVSARDFRLCDTLTPKIFSPPQDIVAKLNSDVFLHCNSNASSFGLTKWYIGSKVIAYYHRKIVRAVQPERMILFGNGTLFLKSVKYGDSGTFSCHVINGKIGAYVVHKLEVQSQPMVEAGIYVGGQKKQSFDFNAGQEFSLKCKSLAVPPPLITWLKDGKPVSPSQDIKLNKLQEPTGIPGVKTIDVLEIYVKSFQSKDAGKYTCQSVNKYGESNTFITLTK